MEFGPEKNVLWKVGVPSGYSSPIVVGDELVLTAFDGGKLFTIAYGRADGKELWRREAPAERIELYHQTEGSPAASTPVTDGKRIVSYFGSCGLFSYDLDGKELWRHPLPMAETASDFGTGVSPIIAEGLVVVVRDLRKNSKLIAVNVATGKLAWERPRDSFGGHSTPAVWQTPQGPQIVVPGMRRMIAYDLKTGAEKWWVTGMPAMCCASPVVGDGLLYFAAWSPGEDMEMPTFDAFLESAGQTKQGYVTKEGNEKSFMKGFFEANDTNRDGKITREEWTGLLSVLSMTRNSAMAVKPGGRGDVTDSHVAWRQPKAKGLPYVPSIIFYRGQCLMVKDGGIVTAYDAKSGEQIYMKRAVSNGRYYSSPVAANGYIYLTSLDTGIISVMKAGGDSPEVVAKNDLDTRIAATPAIADDTLYVRTEKFLWAFGEK